MAQAQLVAAARSKAKSNSRMSDKSPSLFRKTPKNNGEDTPRSPRGDRGAQPPSPRGERSPAASPRGEGGGGGGGGGSPRSSPVHLSPAPPPLPKKKELTKEGLQDFIFCVDCGARNKPHRTRCVKCNEELDIPDDVRRRLPRKGDASKSVVCGAGVESSPQRAEGVARFTVSLRDSSGEPVAAATGGRLEVLIEGPSGEIEARVTPVEGDESSVAVEYDQSEPGAYQVMVSLDEAEVDDAPYVVDVLLVVQAVKCTAAGSALESGVMAGQPTELTVVTRDVCGNPCSTGGANVEVVVEAAVDGAASPRSRNLEAPQPVVVDRENGAYDVSFKYPAAGKYSVRVAVNGVAVSGSPFAVAVDKAPTAGSKWQAKFEDEAAQRRKQREEERLAEIERAKEKYLEHAEKAKAAAAAKEAAQLAEEQRQRDIEEHMERMRTEEGDEVRAAVLDKVKAQASNTLYEPVEDPTSPSTSGKKWAAQFNEEDTKRKAQREAERQQEIAQAKDKYLEHASEAVFHAQSKQEMQLAEEARLRDIEEHQRQLRFQNNLGGIAVLESGDGVDSGASVSNSSPSSDTEEPAPKSKGTARAKSADESSEITPSSDSDSDADGDDGEKKQSQPQQQRQASPPQITAPAQKTPRDKASGVANTASSPRTSGASPRPAGRSARGAVPDTGGRVLPYAELKGNAARWQGELDTENLEAYLGDDEFSKVMGITKDKFYQLPSWRRQQIKKERGL